MKHVQSPSESMGPVRLIAGAGTARERRLLEAAADDVMPSETPERLEQALAAWAASPAGRLPAGQLRESTPWARGARLGRWGIVGGIGGLAIVAWLLGRAPDAAAPVAVTPTAPAPLAAAPVAAAPVAGAPVAVEVASTMPAAPMLASPSPVAPALATKPTRRTRGATSHGRSDNAASHGNLLEEARRLDAVRSALGAHDGRAARRELTEYRARFPRGDLALEADVLEADLLLFVGEPERARALANKLLERPDAGRYRQRLAQLIERIRIPAGSNRAPTHMDERR